MSQLNKLKYRPNSSLFRHRIVERYRMGIHNSFEIWQLYGINRRLLHQWNRSYYQFYIHPHIQLNLMRTDKKNPHARIRELERRLKELEKSYKE